MTSNGSYSKLYDEIAARRDLSPGARLLFTVMLGMARTSGRCYASNGGLARRAGLSTTQVKSLLLRLQDAGMIAKEPDDFHHRAGIQILWEAPDPVKKVDNPPCQETGQGDPVKKVDRDPVKKSPNPVKKVDRLEEQTSQQRLEGGLPTPIQALSKQTRGGGSSESQEGTTPAPATDGGEQMNQNGATDIATIRANLGLDPIPAAPKRLGKLAALFESAPADDPVIAAERARRRPKQNPLPAEQDRA